MHQRKWKGTFHDSSCLKTEREKRNGVPQASCPVGMNVLVFFCVVSICFKDFGVKSRFFYRVLGVFSRIFGVVSRCFWCCIETF